MRGTVEARKLWKVESAYNPWTHISHNEILIAKFYQPSKKSTTTHAPRGIDCQEKTIARPRLPLIRKTIKETPHASNLSHNGYHTCMLRDLQTSTQVSLQSTTTNQHDSNITIFISQNYCKESNISYSAIYKFMQDFMTNHVNDQFLSSL